MILKPVGVEYMEIIESSDIVQLANDLEAYPLSIVFKNQDITIDTPAVLQTLLEHVSEVGTYPEWSNLEEDVIEEILTKADGVWGMHYDETTGLWIVHSIDEDVLKQNISQYNSYVAKRNGSTPKMGALAVRTTEQQSN